MKTTAKDFLWDVTHGQDLEKFNIPIIMVEFAQKHVEEALKQASEKFDADCNKYAVLNSYKLENI